MLFSAAQLFDEGSNPSSLPVLAGTAALPEDWLISDVFEVTVDLNPAYAQNASDSKTAICGSPEGRHSMTIQVKVHPVCEVSREALRAARQASIRALEEQEEASSGAIGSLSHRSRLGLSATLPMAGSPRSLPRSLSR